MSYNLETFTFSCGKHKSRKDGMCLMETVAWLAGEKHSDNPKCADPVIAQMARTVNDRCTDEMRNELLQDLPWRIIGTRLTIEVEQIRARMVADWAVRIACPLILRTNKKLIGLADDLARVPEIVDRDTAIIGHKEALALSERMLHRSLENYGEALMYAQRSALLASRSPRAGQGKKVADNAAAIMRLTTFATYAEPMIRSAVLLLDKLIKVTEISETKILLSSRAQRS